MGCCGSKEDYETSAEPARTAKSSYKPTGPGHTLGGSSSEQFASGGTTSSVPAGSVAAAAAARREEALRAAESRAKTKLKPQPPAEAADGRKNVTGSDTLAWN
ncbi:hypothetical protein DRE_01370 [Drechslerella stenobrocha 248]|uniref:Uncharacterized protein n=1 Tax=Drechslerella stenobrocha 248 TaxID=1043628 RepID=W7HVW3_9PEZI|nr:hypothetical protein DRE_01370 [Drechslerella stenobrocha 248]